MLVHCQCSHVSFRRAALQPRQPARLRRHQSRTSACSMADADVTVALLRARLRVLQEKIAAHPTHRSRGGLYMCVNEDDLPDDLNLSLHLGVQVDALRAFVRAHPKLTTSIGNGLKHDGVATCSKGNRGWRKGSVWWWVRAAGVWRSLTAAAAAKPHATRTPRV